MARTYAEECAYLEKLSDCSYRIKKGFVPNMNVKCMNKDSVCLSKVKGQIAPYRLRDYFM